jgi:hypothetical protein
MVDNFSCDSVRLCANGLWSKLRLWINFNRVYPSAEFHWRSESTRLS